MDKYFCEKCGKEFNEKSGYIRHKNRKVPCIYEDKLIELIDKSVEERLRNIKTNIKNTDCFCEKCGKQFTTKSHYTTHINKKIPCISQNKLQELILKSEEKFKKLINEEVEKSKLKVLDLFCGCGGLSKGLEDSGLNIIAGIDFWDKAIDNYKKNFKHLGICEDLTQFPPEKFDTEYNKNTEIDILVGGPSCQAYSVAGKRDPNDPRASLFMEYVKYLNYFNPKAFIMENVIGILSAKTSKGENVIDIILDEFNKNYNTIVCKLYASDFEVPQNRRRTIIIGIRKDLNIIPTEPIIISENRPQVKNVLLSREEFDKLLDAKSYYLSEKALQGIKNKREKSKESGKGFGAQFLNLDKPSYTIPARYWKDGYDALVKYSDTEIRRLTILELKRIQSFPDNFILEGSKKDVITQIGNAVACRFAYHLGKHMQNLLSTIKKYDINNCLPDREEERGGKRPDKKKIILSKGDIQNCSPEKQQIIELFINNVKGKEINISEKNHCGSEGYWLETQMGIKHNDKNEPDIYGYEMKKESKKISFGDFSASEYLYSKQKLILNKQNNWEESIVNISRIDFIHYFGIPNKLKNNRFSWSGFCVPTYNCWNSCGQILKINEQNDICIYYSYAKDTRKIKETYPNFLKSENILIVLWKEEKIKKHINDKFNNKGFFICKKKDDKYEKICFGKPFNFDYFIQNIKNGLIKFDSGMCEDNSRNYSQFRSINNDFWDTLLYEEY